MKESIKYYEEMEVRQNRKLKSHVLSYEWAIYETVGQHLLSPQHPCYEKVVAD